MLDLEGAEAKKFENYVKEMAGQVRKGDHKWENVEFKVGEFDHYKGFMYLQRNDGNSGHGI